MPGTADRQTAHVLNILTAPERQSPAAWVTMLALERPVVPQEALSR